MLQVGCSLVFPFLLCAWLSLDFEIARAQDATPAQQPTVITYTVASGDSLYVIASRFGSSVEAIVAANNIADATLIRVGQVLVIPDATALPPLTQPNTEQPSAAPVPAIPTAIIRARAGDTLQRIAQRTNQPVELLVSLNQIAATQRLFPGKPVLIPLTSNEAEPLRFGALTSLNFPTSIKQGRTGRLFIQTNRPLALTISLGTFNLPIQPFANDPLRYFAFLPINALLEPGPYPLTVSYVTTNSVPVSRMWDINVLDGGYAFQQIELAPEKSGLLAPELVQSEFDKVSALWSPITPQLYWTAVFSRPLGSQYNTTSPFGTRRTYNDGVLQGFHAGQDFSAPAGVPVGAAGSGVVVLAEPLQVRGNAVILDHGGGVYSGYWHLSELKVAVGQVVNVGDVIGLVGTTGLSTGTHLHWELRIYGVAVDPMQFLEEGL